LESEGLDDNGKAGCAWPAYGGSLAFYLSHDGKVSVAESELLRTICGVLHCPLPAMLERG
jgi:hypothetical protein